MSAVLSSGSVACNVTFDAELVITNLMLSDNVPETSIADVPAASLNAVT